MSEISILVEDLTDSEAAVEYMERALAANPTDEILQINANSVRKRRDDLTQRLNYLLHTKQAEFVRYRILRSWTDSYPTAAVAKSMLAFQELVTAVFDAVRSRKPKAKYQPSPENASLSALDFAGAATGSVVVAMTVPNDRLIVGETDLDNAFQLVERVLSARASEDLNLLKDTVGISSITKAYAWAQTSVSFGLDTQFSWGKRYTDLHKVEITKDEAEIVRALIDAKTETVDEETEVRGILHGHDGDRSYFHLTTSDERELIGDVDPALPKVWTTGKPYIARVRRLAQLKYATGQEIEKWTLKGLLPIDE
jgi:hypothetical protein